MVYYMLIGITFPFRNRSRVKAKITMYPFVLLAEAGDTYLGKVSSKISAWLD